MMNNPVLYPGLTFKVMTRYFSSFVIYRIEGWHKVQKKNRYIEKEREGDWIYQQVVVVVHIFQREWPITMTSDTICLYRLRKKNKSNRKNYEIGQMNEWKKQKENQSINQWPWYSIRKLSIFWLTFYVEIIEWNTESFRIVIWQNNNNRNRHRRHTIFSWFTKHKIIIRNKMHWYTHTMMIIMWLHWWWCLCGKREGKGLMTPVVCTISIFVCFVDLDLEKKDRKTNWVFFHFIS